MSEESAAAITREHVFPFEPPRSLEQEARVAASRLDWKKAVVFQLAVVQGVPSEESPGGGADWFRGHFRLLRWQMSAADWMGAMDTLEQVVPRVSRSFPRARSLMGWLTLARGLVHYKLGRGDRFRRALATVLSATRRIGSKALHRVARCLAELERARQKGRGDSAPAEDLMKEAIRVTFEGISRPPQIKWSRFTWLWTGPIQAGAWFALEGRDDGPESINSDDLARIEDWLDQCESAPTRVPCDWQVPWLARHFELAAARIEPKLRRRLLSSWGRLTPRVQEPYARAVALVSLAEIALWCVDSDSGKQVGKRVAWLRTDLGLAAGLFRRLGLRSRASNCEEQWALFTRLKMAPSAGPREAEVPASGDADPNVAPSLLPRTPGPRMTGPMIRRKATVAGFITQDDALLRQLGRIMVLAPTPLPILIGGESGTGKEVIARAVHDWSGVSGEFVAIHCGAIPRDLLESELFGHTRGAFTGASGEKPGLVEVADGGTLFLDEIGEMGADAQMKLLRVLESGEVRRVGATRVQKVQVRIVAATHRNLEALVAEGSFRLDLLHRICGVEMSLSPLRQRRRDVLPLALHLLRPHRQKWSVRLSDSALGVLLAYDWPGNVRELKSVLHRAAYLAMALGRTTIEPGCLGLGPDAKGGFQFAMVPSDEASSSDNWTEQMGTDVSDVGLEVVLERLERRLISEALNDNDWNRTRAASSLGGLSRTTLISKMKRLGLDDSVRKQSRG